MHGLVLIEVHKIESRTITESDGGGNGKHGGTVIQRVALPPHCFSVTGLFWSLGFYQWSFLCTPCVQVDLFWVPWLFPASQKLASRCIDTKLPQTSCVYGRLESHPGLVPALHPVFLRSTTTLTQKKS